MAPTRHTSVIYNPLSRALVAVAIAAAATGATPAGPLARASLGIRGALTTTSSTISATAGQRPVSGLYGWPLKPFDRQHPVRGFFNDPRIGGHGGRSFHFGIDIAAADGTPVYAVEAGTVHRNGGRAIAIVAPGGSHTFGYWHIVPAVAHLQRVEKHQLIGHVAARHGHVHFAERRASGYVNPLRPGALAPYVDPEPPTVREIAIRQAAGGIEIDADAFDTTWPRVPGKWADLPVTPVLTQWRARDGRGAFGPWTLGTDFRDGLRRADRFSNVYGPATRQNHAERPGVFIFRLSKRWRPADGTYVVEVRATDTRQNTATLRETLTIDDGLVVE